MFVRSVGIRARGGSKVIYIPPEWGFKPGDWVLVRVAKPKDPYPLTITTRIRKPKTAGAYITVPPEWPFYVDDIVDVKLTYGDIPRAEVDDATRDGDQA